MKTIFLIFSLCLSTYLYSQEQMNLKWGVFQEINKEAESMYYLGIWPEDSTSFMFLVDDRIEIYDSKFHLTQRIELRSHFSGSELITCIRKNNKVYFVLKNKNTVYWNTFDKKNISISDSHSSFDLKSKDPIYYKFSNDTSAILFYTEPNSKNKEVNIYVYKYNGGKMFESVVIGDGETIGSFEPFFYDNNVLYFSKKGSKVCISIVNKAASGSVMCSIEALNSKIAGAKAIMNNDKWNVVLAYYKEGINYNCLEQINILELSSKAEILSNKSIILDKCINEAILTDIFINKDTLILVSERFTTKINNSGNQISFGSFDILSVNTNELKLNWQTEIFKNHYSVVPSNVFASPYSKEYKQLHSHILMNYKNNLYFIYNDNCNNSKQGATTPRSHAAIDKSCVNMVRVNMSNGEFRQYGYPAFAKHRYSLIMNNCIVASENKLFLYSKNNQYRLGVLTLPAK